MEIKLDDRFRLMTRHGRGRETEPLLADDQGDVYAPDEEVPPSYELACDIVEQFLSGLFDDFRGGLISAEDYESARTFVLRGHDFSAKKSQELEKRERKQDSMRQRKSAKGEAERLAAEQRRRRNRLRMIIANVVFVGIILFLALLMLLT